MDTRVRATMATLQAFKLSANAEKEAEPPVLDLSCKKQQSCKKEETSDSSNYRAPLCSEDSSNLRASSSGSSSNNNNGKQQETTNRFSTYENKSLFEVCACMVTPPSSGGETDSPKKRKYNRTNVVGKEGIDHNANPVMPACLPMSVVPTTLPALVRQNVSNKPDQLSATSSVQRDLEAPTSLSSEPSNKVLRPFKAYPKNPMSLSMGAAEIMYDQSSIEAYSKFRERMLESVRKTNEGPNIRMRRVMRNSSSPTSTVDEKNAAYLERRKKNNEAAKRSRDARRAKEDEIAIRAAFLEQENMQLKYEIVALREETAKLRHMVFGS